MRVFVATWLCYAGYYFGRRPFYILKSQLAQDLGFSATTLGQVGAVYLVTYALAQFLAGALGNRFGPRVMLLSGMAVSMAANVGFGVATSSSAFFVLMAVNGAAQATGWSAGVGTMASWFNRQERGRVMGIWATNFQAGGVAANWLTALVLGHFDWRTALFSSLAVFAAVWLVVLVNQRNRPADLGLPDVKDEGEVGSGDGKSDASPGLGWTRDATINVVLVGSYYFFLKLIRYALWSWVPFVLARNYGLSGSDAGYVSTVFDLCGIPGVIITGWLSDKVFGARRAGISLFMTVAMALSCLLLFSAGQVSVTMFAVAIGLIGFTLYGPDALLTGAGAMDIGSRRAATLAAGIISGIGSCGPVVQELVIARMLDTKGGDLGPVFMLLLASSLAATVLLGVVVLRNRLGHSSV
jgi:sugar phosphate permease